MRSLPITSSSTGGSPNGTRGISAGIPSLTAAKSASSPGSTFVVKTGSTLSGVAVLNHMYDVSFHVSLRTRTGFAVSGIA